MNEDRCRIPHQNIILIGMPAVGKSTVGVVLAKRMGFSFYDTDLLIQTGEGERLSTIIQRIGVENFCDLERDYVRQLAVRETVIATGGSVVYRDAAMAHLKQLGCIVFLDIRQAVLAQRLKEMDDRGVVRMPGQTIDQIHSERHPLYRRHADITVDSTDCTVEQTLVKVQAALRRD